MQSDDLIYLASTNKANDWEKRKEEQKHCPRRILSNTFHSNWQHGKSNTQYIPPEQVFPGTLAQKALNSPGLFAPPKPQPCLSSNKELFGDGQHQRFNYPLLTGIYFLESVMKFHLPFPVLLPAATDKNHGLSILPLGWSTLLSLYLFFLF